MANPVVWFEIPATDLTRAKKFYEAVLKVELTLQNMDPLKMAWFPMEQNATGSTGSLVQGEGYAPSHSGSVVYLSVDDMDSALQRVEQGGGKILNPKRSIGEYGFVGHFQDSEGNRVALHSES